MSALFCSSLYRVSHALVTALWCGDQGHKEFIRQRVLRRNGLIKAIKLGIRLVGSGGIGHDGKLRNRVCACFVRIGRANEAVGGLVASDVDSVNQAG